MMKVTVLVENSAIDDFECEHGLSFHIEYNGLKILLDAGKTNFFFDNACKMNIDLSCVDFAILSHGHYDHSGGFKKFFEVNSNATVYAREQIYGEYYSLNGGIHSISVPKEVLENRNRFTLINNSQNIFDGIYLIGHHTENLNIIGEKTNLYKKDGEKIVPDDFAHEQSLIFDTEKGLVVFNSCSHAGIGNIIREVREYYNSKSVYAFIGGLHLLEIKDGKEGCSFSEKEIDALCDVIKREQIELIYTGHCTGCVGYKEIKKRLGKKVCALHSGMQFEI